MIDILIPLGARAGTGSVLRPGRPGGPGGGGPDPYSPGVAYRAPTGGGGPQHRRYRGCCRLQLRGGPQDTGSPAQQLIDRLIDNLISKLTLKNTS